MMFTVKSFGELSKAERVRLRELTIDHDSMMRSQLDTPSEHGALVAIFYRLGETIVGWASLERRASGHAWLNVYVDRAYRGRGIANALVGRAVRVAQERFGRTIITAITNDEAGHALYHKAGFNRLREWIFDTARLEVHVGASRRYRSQTA